MANYSLIINSQFDPFTYDDLVKPINAATAAHQNLEDIYGTLESEANKWEKIAGQEEYTRNLYNNYINSVYKNRDELLQHGLNPTSRNTMSNIRARFNKEIAPIETAFNRRNELMKTVENAQIQDPTRMFERDPSKMTLESLIKNPSLDYGKQYSGAMLTNQVTEMAKYLAKELSEYGKGKPLDKFTNTFLQRHGFTKEQVLDAIYNPDPTSQSILNAIVSQAIGSSGIANWASPEQLARFRNYATSGLYAAIGETSVSPFENKGAVLAAQEASARRTAAYQQQLANNAQGVRFGARGIEATPFFGGSGSKNALQQVDMENWIKKGYVTKNGQLTKKGRYIIEQDARLYAAARNSKKGGAYENPFTITQLREPSLYQFYADASRGSKTGLQNVTNFNQKFRKTLGAYRRGEIPVGTANIDVYRINLSGDDRSGVMTRVAGRIGENGSIYKAVAFDPKTGKMKYDKGMSQKDFSKLAKDDKVTAISLINSPVTDEQFVELSNGQIYKLPGGYFGSETYRTLRNNNEKLRNLAKKYDVLVGRARTNSEIEKLNLLNSNNFYLSTGLNGVKSKNLEYEYPYIEAGGE